MHAGVRISCLMLICAMLPACSGGGTNDLPSSQSSAPAAASSAPTSSHAFVSKAWGFRIDAPPGWTLRRDFQSSYLANGAWKTFATPDSQGRPVLSLTMPDSNQVTDAEIRIGASRVPAEVQRCTAPPSALRGNVGTERINGIDFTTFEAADAAMSHHLDVHAYRVVHGGACYAIDLLVFGVNPEVYDPPATPPFSDAHAFDAMRAVMRTFGFEQPSGQSAANASTAAR
jgi:hypothetical protein